MSHLDFHADLWPDFFWVGDHLYGRKYFNFNVLNVKWDFFEVFFKHCVAIEVASLALLITWSFFCLWYLILKGFSKLTHFVWRLRFFAFLLIFRSIVLNMIKHLWKMSKCSLLSFNWRKRWLNGKKEMRFSCLTKNKESNCDWSIRTCHLQT